MIHNCQDLVLGSRRGLLQLMAVISLENASTNTRREKTTSEQIQLSGRKGPILTAETCKYEPFVKASSITVEEQDLIQNIFTYYIDR